jgi:hypothetical protein
MKSTLLAVAAAAALFAACGDSDSTGVVSIDARGSYDLSTLRFDPQGSLPDTDLRTSITGTIPKLTLATNGQAQLVFTDPATGLITVSNATYSVTSAGIVKLDFGTANTLYRTVFLSRNMSFTYNATAKTLTFAGTSPDGVSRARLIQVATEFQNEQLLDPVPGVLTVAFTASATAQ